MKQRLSVRAIIRNDEKTLLLRRANGRHTILNQYELPGGRLAYGEQPEDALRRYLHDDAGLHIQTAQLFDAVTYIDHDERDIQYGVIVYLVAIAGTRSVTLGQNYDKYLWQKVSAIRQDSITDLSQLLLGIVYQKQITDSANGLVQNGAAHGSGKQDGVIIYSDGGSRGNPGPSAAGYVIMDLNQEVVDQGGEYLGITTNNQAEYQGVRIGLEKALSLGIKRVDFRIDSMLVVNQMNGIYKIKNRELWPINERIRGLMTQFDKVTFSHVRREFNQLADGMVNRTLNEHEDDQ
jgi:ribonuclease HI